MDTLMHLQNQGLLPLTFLPPPWISGSVYACGQLPAQTPFNWWPWDEAVSEHLTPRELSADPVGSLCFLQGLLIIYAGNSTLPLFLALTKETTDQMGSSNLSSTDWIHLGWRERSFIWIKLWILHQIQCLKANIFTEFYSWLCNMVSNSGFIWAFHSTCFINLQSCIFCMLTGFQSKGNLSRSDSSGDCAAG